MTKTLDQELRDEPQAARDRQRTEAVVAAFVLVFAALDAPDDEELNTRACKAVAWAFWLFVCDGQAAMPPAVTSSDSAFPKVTPESAVPTAPYESVSPAASRPPRSRPVR
jgi:hypothetical protein